MGKNKRNKNNDFVIQGSILAIASVVSRIIGMIYRVPLTNIIGDEGNGYYSVAYEVYSMVLLLSSFSLPLAVSKLVAARVGKGERKNAYKVYQCAMIFAIIVGIISSLVLFFGADFITAKLMKQAAAAFALKTLAPALFLVAIAGVIRGYFQGLGSMVPTAASQIIEQIVNAIVSVAAAGYLFKVGVKAAKLTGNSSTPYAYGAGGGTLGTGIGGVFAVIFLIFVMMSYRRVLNRQMRRDHTRNRESTSQIYKILIWTIVPVALSTVVYNISTIIDQGVFNSVLKSQGMKAKEYAALWGIFSGRYKLLVNVPVSLASAVASSVIPGLTIAVANKEHKVVSQKINTAIRFTMVITIPCAVGLTVLALPILQLIFSYNSNLDTAANLFRFGSVAVVFYSLSTLTNGILQGINKMKIPLRNAIISLVLHLGILYILLSVFKLGIYAQVIAFIIFAFLMCVLNAIGIRNNIPYVQEVKRTFLIPVAASAVMGAAAYFVQLGLSKVIGGRISTIIAIGVAVVIYGVLLLLFKEFEREELLSMPKGHLIVAMAEKFGLM